MSIEIDGIQFEGPYTDINRLEDRSGVYAILDQRTDKTILLDAGESSEVRSRISNHDRKSCWNSHSQGTVSVAVIYTPNLQQTGRKELEQKIRNKYNPTCGDR
jgi:hypothetical protein